MGICNGKLAQAVVPSVAAGGGLRDPLLHPTRRTHAPTRVAVAFRTAHLHSGPIARTKLRCAFDAPIILSGLFRPFRTPKNLGGGRPLAGLCSTAVRSGLAGQEGGGRQEGGRRGGEGPFLSHWTCGPQVPRVCAPMARVRRNDARSSIGSGTPLPRGMDWLGPTDPTAAWLGGCTPTACAAQRRCSVAPLPFRRRRALRLRSMYFGGSAFSTQ